MGLAVECYLDDLVLRNCNTLLSGSYACIVTSSVFHGQKFWQDFMHLVTCAIVSSCMLSASDTQSCSLNYYKPLTHGSGVAVADTKKLVWDLVLGLLRMVGQMYICWRNLLGREINFPALCIQYLSFHRFILDTYYSVWRHSWNDECCM